MIIDYESLFAEEQGVTVTAFASKVMNIGQGGDTAFEENDVYAVCAEDVAAAGNATVAISFETSDAATKDANGSYTMTNPEVLATFRAVPKAELVAGKTLCRFRVPQGCKKYIGVRFNVTNGPLTAGKFTVYMTTAH